MRSALGCALLGLLLLLVAGAFDAEPFYVTGSALLVLGPGARWIGVGAWGATVHRPLGARSVVEEEPLGCGSRPSPGACRCLPGTSTSRCCPADPGVGRPPPLPAADRGDVRRRGRRVLEPPTLVLRDPLGLAQRTITGPEPDEVLVLPRTLPVRAAAGGERPGARAALLTSAAETEIDGLRPHLEGSPASRIHWPNSPAAPASWSASSSPRPTPGHSSSRPADRRTPRPSTRQSAPPGRCRPLRPAGGARCCSPATAA